jgi:cellulose synthase/poly-beta-1,6-N-acetylglucosamine synthase-like glycosyltransferase
MLVPSIIMNAIKAAKSFGRWPRKLRLEGDDVPGVDVVITVCNESVSILYDTVMAALAVDYPKDRFRVIVSDDGNCPQLATMIGELRSQGHRVFYTARVKEGASGYKAANLNHALAFAGTLPGGPADFIANLDADMIPEKRWLRSVMAHLVRDKKCGLACPPQVGRFPPNSCITSLEPSLRRIISLKKVNKPKAYTTKWDSRPLTSQIALLQHASE